MITVIISLSVSLLVALLFRHLDKNHRSLTKIKDFTDRVRKDFDGYFNNQQESIKNQSIDLDVQKTQTIATIKSLQNLQKEFDEKKSTLNAQISEITQMGNKISQYDEAIKELTQMSLAVEENLARIKKESGIIDKLDSKIAEQKQLLDSLEKRIPLIEKNFEAKNEESLSAISKTLLDDYKQQTDNIIETTEQAVRRNEQIISQITQSFDNVFAVAAEKAEKLEADAFEKLKENAQQRALK